MAKKLPKIINQTEFEQLFSAVEHLEKRSKTPRLKKNLKAYRVAMLLGFEAGMRISEIIGLKKLKSRCCDADLNVRKEKSENKYKKTIYSCSKCNKDELTKKEVYRTETDEWAIPKLSKEQIEVASIRIVQGKGKKDRVVPRPKRLNEAAVSMLPLKIKRRALQISFKNLCKRILNKDLHFHSLRHSFATHYYEKTGGDLIGLQSLLGHSSIETTSIYAHINPVKLIEKAREVF